MTCPDENVLGELARGDLALMLTIPGQGLGNSAIAAVAPAARMALALLDTARVAEGAMAPTRREIRSRVMVWRVVNALAEIGRKWCRFRRGTATLST